MSTIANFDFKQPGEEFFLGMDFTDDIGADAIASATVTATEWVTGEDATDDLIQTSLQTITSPVVYFWMKQDGGTDRTAYKITCRAVLDSGAILENDAMQVIREK